MSPRVFCCRLHWVFPALSPSAEKCSKSFLPSLSLSLPTLRDHIQRKTWYMGPYAGVNYNLTVSPLQRRLQHIYYGQPFARVDLSPIYQSRLYPPSQGLWIWPLFSKSMSAYVLLLGGGGVVPNLRQKIRLRPNPSPRLG
jgi:hypothetical protein